MFGDGAEILGGNLFGRVVASEQKSALGGFGGVERREDRIGLEDESVGVIYPGGALGLARIVLNRRRRHEADDREGNDEPAQQFFFNGWVEVQGGGCHFHRVGRALAFRLFCYIGSKANVLSRYT